MAVADSVTGFFSGATGGIGGVFEGVKIFGFYILPVLIIIVMGFIFYRDKTIFKYKVRMFRIRENGKVKESNYKAGYMGRVGSGQFFRIKTGKMWWQQIDLLTTPIVKYMDEDNRVYYLQSDVGTFVQMKKSLDITTGIIFYTQVEGQDVKYSTILSGKRIKDILRTEPTWKKLLPYAGILILAIIFVVAYAVVYNQAGV